jgi:hypothetical protein
VYVDFSRLYRINESEAWFVVRIKVDKQTGAHSDQIGKLVTPKSLKDYPDKIRKVTFYDIENDRELVFVTKNLELKRQK